MDIEKMWVILLMQEILHHLGKLPTSTGAGFLPSTAALAIGLLTSSFFGLQGTQHSLDLSFWGSSHIYLKALDFSWGRGVRFGNR